MNKLEYLMDQYIVGLDNYMSRDGERVYHIIIYTADSAGPACDIKGSNLYHIINKAYQAIVEEE